MAYRFRNITGPLIRVEREGLGLTQSDFAAKLQLAGLAHIDRGCLSKIEAGTRSVYDYELAIIAEVLGITTGSLFPQVKNIKKSLNDLIPPQFAKGE